jgi:hypothetical protein
MCASGRTPQEDQVLLAPEPADDLTPTRDYQQARLRLLAGRSGTITAAIVCSASQQVCSSVVGLSSISRATPTGSPQLYRRRAHDRPTSSRPPGRLRRLHALVAVPPGSGTRLGPSCPHRYCSPNPISRGAVPRRAAHRQLPRRPLCHQGSGGAPARQSPRHCPVLDTAKALGRRAHLVMVRHGISTWVRSRSATLSLRCRD